MCVKCKATDPGHPFRISWGHRGEVLVLTISYLQSGILSALPFVFGCVCIILGGLLADFLLSRKILRLVTIRKLFTTIGKGQAVY